MGESACVIVHASCADGIVRRTTDMLRETLHLTGILYVMLTSLIVIPTASFGQEVQSYGKRAHELVADSAGSAKLSMLFRGGTAEECRVWQRGFRKKVMELLGDSTPPSEWTVNEQSRRHFDDYLRLELWLHAEGVPSLPVYLLIPNDISAQKPASGVLCVHGHGPLGNDSVVGRAEVEGARQLIDDRNYDYGLQFVRRGYVVVAPCMVPFGRRVDRDFYRKTDPCAAIFVRMQAMGKLLITENLRDLRWSISFLQSRPEV